MYVLVRDRAICTDAMLSFVKLMIVNAQVLILQYMRMVSLVRSQLQIG